MSSSSSFRTLRTRAQSGIEAQIQHAKTFAQQTVLDVLSGNEGLMFTTAAKLCGAPVATEVSEEPQQSTIPERRHDRPLRILSLDGGGVRGYSALLILRDIMARVQDVEGSENPILPADYFDLIIGTSTGGIMALMLGRLRMTIDECLEAYRTLAQKAFSAGIFLNTINACSTMIKAGGPSIYNEEKLEKCIKRTIGAHTDGGHDDILLHEPSPDACRTAVVTALSADATRPILLRSYLPGDPRLRTVKVWEAARATSAAPLFFKPVAIGPEKVSYVDGAVTGHCNPTALALEEVEKLWPDREIGLLLSLGTGSPSKIPLQGQAHQILQALVNLSTTTVRTHEDTFRTFDRLYAVSPYVRFTVDYHIEKIRLDDYSSLPKLAEDTFAYLQKVSHEVQHCVDLATGTLQPRLKSMEE